MPVRDLFKRFGSTVKQAAVTFDQFDDMVPVLGSIGGDAVAAVAYGVGGGISATGDLLDGDIKSALKTVAGSAAGALTTALPLAEKAKFVGLDVAAMADDGATHFAGQLLPGKKAAPHQGI